MKALLIIDMQRESFMENTPRFDTEQVIDRINRLSRLFRAGQDMVIYILHDGTDSGNFIPGSEEWSLLASLEQAGSDHFVSKKANDCFHKSALISLLESNGVSELVITGCATDFCVDATVKSAYTHGYHIAVIADGHTTADRSGIEAVQLIEHYNWVWQNMLPVVPGSLRVVSCEDYIAEQKADNVTFS